MYFTCRLLYESRMWSFWNNWFRSVRSYKRFTKGWIRTPSLTSAPIVGWMCLLPTYRKYAKRHWSDNKVCHIIVGSTKPEVCLAAPPPVSMVCLFVNHSRTSKSELLEVYSLAVWSLEQNVYKQTHNKLRFSVNKIYWLFRIV